MSVEAVQEFYVKCDEPGCNARTPERESGVTWSSYSSAEKWAAEVDWKKRGTLHFCPQHSAGGPS